MNKVLRIILKVIGISVIAFVSIIVLSLVLLFHKPKPTVSQLEKACGVHFPSFTIIEKDEATGNHANYYYTIKFKEPLGKEVLDQIDYLCKYGEMLDDGIRDYMPWTNDDGRYSFYVDAMFDGGPYVMPMNCRSIDLNLDKNSELMTVHYMMVD